MIKFGSARNGENGVRGNKPGDENGREVSIQEAYWHRNGWIVIRAKDPNVANGLAFCMAVACQVDSVGYDQDDRYSIFWTGIHENVPTECDCSSLVAWCVNQCGIPVDASGFWTGNEIQRLRNTGAFDVFNCGSLEELCTGDILVDGSEQCHTVIVTEGKPRINGNYFDEPAPTLQYGSRGEEVRKLQEFFNRFCDGNLETDGIYGRLTRESVVNFQNFWQLVPDGIYGQRTHEAVCFGLWCNGVQAV